MLKKLGNRTVNSRGKTTLIASVRYIEHLLDSHEDK